MPQVSVIVRTYNEEKRLPGLLDGLAGQTYQDFEVVIVDSGSYDRTREIAKQRADRLVRIASHDFTFGHSLNVGIQNTVGRFLAIVSAHTRPVASHRLARLVAPLHDPKVAMVYGQQRGVRESKFSEILDFERTFGSERKLLTPRNFFANNANSAIRRDLWAQHPFDEALPGLEDLECAKYWTQRGYHIVYEPLAGIYHIHEETWEQVRRRYYREGQAVKWIGFRGRRDIPGELCREVRYFFGDIRAAWLKRQLKRERE